MVRIVARVRLGGKNSAGRPLGLVSWGEKAEECHDGPVGGQGRAWPAVIWMVRTCFGISGLEKIDMDCWLGKIGRGLQLPVGWMVRGWEKSRFLT